MKQKQTGGGGGQVSSEATELIHASYTAHCRLHAAGIAYPGLYCEVCDAYVKWLRKLGRVG
jgi:hypothetical protein